MTVGVVQFLTSCNIVQRRADDACRHILRIYIANLLQILATTVCLNQILVVVGFGCAPDGGVLDSEVCIESST